MINTQAKLKGDDADKFIADIAKPIVDNLVQGPVKKIEVTDEEKEAYWKSIMSDQLFYWTTSLLGGKIKITYRTLSVEENNDVYKQFQMDREASRARADEGYFYLMTIYRAALAVHSVEVDGEVKEFLPEFIKANIKDDLKNHTSYVHARATQLFGWPDQKLKLYLAGYDEFEQKCFRLTEEVKNKDFWKAAV